MLDSTVRQAPAHPAESASKRRPQPHECALSLRQMLLLAALASASEEDPLLGVRLHEILDMDALERDASAFLDVHKVDEDPHTFREAIVRYAKAVFFDYGKPTQG